MKKFYFFALAAATIALSYKSGQTKDNGVAGNTGSSGEKTCNDCHGTGTDNLSGGTISLTSSNMTNWEYVPGQVYNFDLTISRTGSKVFGLGVEALNSSNANGGILGITNTTQTSTKNAGTGRTNVVHKLNGGLTNDTKTFAFKWTAPTSNIGNVTFYYTGVAGNNNGNDDSGDYTYKGTQIITPSASTAVPFLSSTEDQIAQTVRFNENNLIIAFNGDKKGMAQIDVRSIDGRLIYSGNTFLDGNAFIESISLNNSTICKGIVLVTVQMGTVNNHFKVLNQ